ncbi:glutathione S-transferase family protein [Seohaeicola saemankumensis]|nr:glutathione S-transferase family protein [Seohaeicola saemankumensis]MCA0869965.1 glutathione S-transferase family protein [Seohaeicola saemankumensis]
MMRLFHSPGSCSEGILLLLEEIGAPFEVEVIDLKQQAQRDPAYLAVNPKGKVPALLRPDGTVLTEFPAIALWLARSFPETGLLGDGLEGEVRALELVDFIVASLHMRGFTLFVVPQKFSPDPLVQAALVAHGRSEAAKGLAHLSERLGDQVYLLGAFGIADAAAWYVLSFAKATGTELPDNLSALHARIAARRS